MHQTTRSKSVCALRGAGTGAPGCAQEEAEQDMLDATGGTAKPKGAMA